MSADNAVSNYPPCCFSYCESADI